MVARKKIDRGKGSKSDEDNVVQRACANRRERQRTKELNDAFSTLRKLIPSMPSDKMSKIHTLRIATDYICFLDEMKRNGGKLFGHSIFDERSGYGLQTSFNLWRSSNGLTTVNMPPMNPPPPPPPSQPMTITHPCLPMVPQPYYLPFSKEFTDLSNCSASSNCITPIHWS
ncbi:unnamed protein product [Caenorhabditis bovis]|uniref:BHLH domain-containing protein n=1 Tax=Caenorhabditis bovis TaxID=2654633 RepID=A0A8S1EG24_9PELO|nr:unnamed protein product [Caenorhabditis bovis]